MFNKVMEELQLYWNMLPKPVRWIIELLIATWLGHQIG